MARSEKKISSEQVKDLPVSIKMVVNTSPVLCCSDFALDINAGAGSCKRSMSLRNLKLRIM